MQDPKDFLEEQLTKILQNNSKESKELSDLKSKLTEITNQLESEQIQSDKLKVQINTLKKPKKNSLQINLSLKEINLKNNSLIKQIKKLKMLNKECIVFNNQLENKIKKLKNVLRNLVEGISNDILIENKLVVEDNYFYENKSVISCEIPDFDYKFVNDYSKFITLFLSKLTEYFSELSQKSESFINLQLIDELLTKFSQIISFYEEKEFFFPKLIYKTEENEFNLQIRKVNLINTEQEKKNKPKEYLKLIQENSDLQLKLQESVKEKEELKIKINKIIKESEEIKRKNDELLKVIENIKQLINNLSNK